MTCHNSNIECKSLEGSNYGSPIVFPRNMNKTEDMYVGICRPTECLVKLCNTAKARFTRRFISDFVQLRMQPTTKAFDVFNYIFKYYI